MQSGISAVYKMFDKGHHCKIKFGVKTYIYVKCV